MITEPKEIMEILQNGGFERSYIEWKENKIPPTIFWYNEETNELQADCGVSIPFNYDVTYQMAKWRYDIITEVKKHYEKQGILLTSTDD